MMDSETLTKRFIDNNLMTYGIKWINTDRVKSGFEFLIYGRPDHGKQIGLYSRNDTVLRLENYDQNFAGVEVLSKCENTLSSESDCSNFKQQKGVCVKVGNTTALKKLMDWYYAELLPS